MGKRTHIFTYIHIFGAGDGKEEVMGKKTHTFAFIRIHSHTFIYMVQVMGKKTHTFIHIHTFAYIHIHSYVWYGRWARLMWLSRLVGLLWGKKRRREREKERSVTHTPSWEDVWVCMCTGESVWVNVIGLFCRISSLLLGSFAKETYNFKEPTTCVSVYVSCERLRGGCD